MLFVSLLILLPDFKSLLGCWALPRGALLARAVFAEEVEVVCVVDRPDNVADAVADEIPGRVTVRRALVARLLVIVLLLLLEGIRSVEMVF